MELFKLPEGKAPRFVDPDGAARSFEPPPGAYLVLHERAKHVMEQVEQSLAALSNLRAVGVTTAVALRAEVLPARLWVYERREHY